jgi:hypothetical protein
MSDNLFVLRCTECGLVLLFDPSYEDPTSSHGACKVCGSHKYAIHETDATHKDEFIAKMSGKSLKYRIIDFNVA